MNDSPAPDAVKKEIEASLDSYIQDWTDGIAQKVQQADKKDKDRRDTKKLRNRSRREPSIPFNCS